MNGKTCKTHLTNGQTQVIQPLALSKPVVEPFTQLLISMEQRQIIAKIAQKYTKGTSIAWEDAAQNAFEKVLEAIRAGRFRQGGSAEFSRWATVVARYKIINFVKKERVRSCQSLDEPIKGTNLPLIDTIPDDFSQLDALTHADLLIQAKQAIITLDLRYPQRHYLKIWQGLLQKTTTTQLAVNLEISQGEISKRWKELVKCVAVELRLEQVDVVKCEQRNSDKFKDTGRRAKAKW